jgi:hypothetical protein
MQKWDYLRLDVLEADPAELDDIKTARINYLREISGIRTYLDLHNYIKQLGSEGWELVSERSSAARQSLYYFKRPIE